jgi:hypothetical protein
MIAPWARDDTLARDALVRDAPVRARAPGPQKRTPLFIVTSPRPSTGKTFVARLVADFLRLDGGTVEAFDLDPEEGSLAEALPELTVKADIGHTRGQMALFDRLIAEDGVAKVVDVEHRQFDRFFALLAEIGFVEETRSRAVELVILFAADAHPASARAYADLQRLFPGAVVVPVFNEAVVKGRKLRESFPFTRAVTVPVHIPLLPPLLKAQVSKGACSFADCHGQEPANVPHNEAVELRSWTKRAFLELRELELRLLLEKLRDSLRG